MGVKVCIGVITAPHGVRGMVKIKPFTEDPRAVGEYGPLMLENGRNLKVEIKSIAKGVVLAKLDQIDDRQTAETLKGELLYIDRDSLPTVDTDKIYQADLVGYMVDAIAIGEIGKVTGIFDFGAGSMLEVMRPKGDSVLIPFGGDHPITINQGRISLEVDPAWLED